MFLSRKNPWIAKLILLLVVISGGLVCGAIRAEARCILIGGVGALMSCDNPGDCCNFLCTDFCVNFECTGGGTCGPNSGQACVPGCQFIGTCAGNC